MVRSQAWRQTDSSLNPSLVPAECLDELPPPPSPVGASDNGNSSPVHRWCYLILTLHKAGSVIMPTFHR